MYCHKCGFITKGIETKCPYCGTKFADDKKIDQKFYMFNWFEVSPRQLISIVCFNVFALMCILDLVFIYAYPEINYHLTPYSFLAIFGVLFLFNEFIYPSNNINKLLFLKYIGFCLAFSILMMISYPAWIDGFELFGKDTFLLAFGYFYPCMITFAFIFGGVRLLVIKNYNVFSTFFYVLLLNLMSLVLFILSFINGLPFKEDSICLLFIYVNFAITVIFSLNALIFTIYRMKSRFSIKS